MVAGNTYQIPAHSRAQTAFPAKAGTQNTSAQSSLAIAVDRDSCLRRNDGGQHVSQPLATWYLGNYHGRTQRTRSS